MLFLMFNRLVILSKEQVVGDDQSAISSQSNSNCTSRGGGLDGGGVYFSNDHTKMLTGGECLYI